MSRLLGLVGRLVLIVAVVLAGLTLPSLAAPPAQAAGSPDVQLTKEVAADTLYGEDVPVTLTATNPNGPNAFNTTFADVLPAGTRYVSTTPADYGQPQQIALADGTTKLVWSNVADLQRGTTVALTYTYAYVKSLYDVGSSIAGQAEVYVTTNARQLPRFDRATGAAVATSYTGSAVATATTALVPFELTKSEPSPEGELLRGVHDHKTVYTLTVQNNTVAATQDASIVDFLPAGLEFLGCTAADASAPGTTEIATDPRRIDATPHPVMTDCVEPTSVTTVTTDPDGTGPLPTAVYTRVEWTGLGALAAGEKRVLQYAAAVPLRENVQSDGVATANLDNNTGPLTHDEQALTNLATASGSYKGTRYESSDTVTVSAEDVRMRKAVSTPVIAQGGRSTWTVTIDSSEYALSTQPIVVTDTIPDGLDFTGSDPAVSTPVTTNDDGTLTATWTLPGFTERNATTTLTYETTARSTYRADGAPVAARDSWTNAISLTTTSAVVTAAAGTTSALATPDASSAGQEAGGVTLEKKVATPASLGSPASCSTSGLDWVDQAGTFSPGDLVCFRLTATFPATLDTLGTTLVDMLPAGYSYESQAATSRSTVTFSSFSGDSTTSDLTWTLPDVTGSPSTPVFETVLTTRITDATAASDADITSNLAKLTYRNSRGAVFQLRDQADATWAEPTLAFTKRVTAVDGTAVTPSATVQAEAGDRITYTLTATNTGGQEARGVSLRDVLPAGWACSASSSDSFGDGVCSADGTRVDWTGLVVPAATTNGSTTTPGVTTVTYERTVPAGASARDVYSNTAGVRTYQGVSNTGEAFDYVPADNVDPSLTTANAASARDTATTTTATPTVTKVVTGTSVADQAGAPLPQATIGETITYRVTAVVPHGTTLYGSPALTDTLPAFLELAGDAPVYTIDGGAPRTARTSGRTVTAPLAADGDTTYVNPAGSSSQDDDVVVLTLTARVVDTGGPRRGNGLSNVAAIVWRGAPTTASDGTVTPGDSRNAFSGAALARVVEPNLAVTKTNDDADGKVEPGQTLNYTVRVTNSGGNTSTAHDVVVTDVLPADLDFVSSPTGSYDADSRTITFTATSVEPGATPTFRYVATVRNPLVGDGTITNSVTVTGSSLAGSVPGERVGGSPTAAAGSGYVATASNSVTGPTFGLTKTNDTPQARTIGEESTYRLEMTIPAQTIAYDTTVFDVLPAGQRFDRLVSTSCASGGAACSPDVSASPVVATPTDGTIAFFVGDLATASPVSRTVTITYTTVVTSTAKAGDVQTNSAFYAFDDTDRISGTPTTTPAPSSYRTTSQARPATATATIVEPKLTLDKRVLGQIGDSDTRRAKPGDTLTYTITVANTGTAPAYDVVVADAPDRRLTGFSSTGAGTVTDGDPGDGSLGWTIPTVAAGASVVVSYTLTVPAGLDQRAEVAGGPEVVNTADVTSYRGVPASDRQPGRDYATYDDVAADTVSVELDLASIGDRVWFDADGDGRQDDGEPGLTGVGVTVTFAGADGVFGTADDEVATTTTGADGSWSVRHLPGGTYRVSVDPTTLPAGLTPSYDLDGLTGPANRWQGTLGEADAKTDVDFGYTGTGSLGDRVWFDQDADGVQQPTEGGVSGVTVTVVWSGQDGLAGTADDVTYTTTTDASGRWSVGALPAGGFAVTVSGLPEGSEVVASPASDGSVLTGADARPSSSTTLTAGQSRSDQDFGVAGTGSIGDYVWLDRDGDGVQDAGEDPLVGVQLRLTWFGADGKIGGGDDTVVDTTTDGDGLYAFDRLLPGGYRVDVVGSLPRSVQNTSDRDGDRDSSTDVTLGAGEKVTDADFGYRASSALGDRVWWDLDRDGVQDAGEPGLPGVTVTVRFVGADGVAGTADDLVFTSTTDSNGGWLVTDVPDGDYVVSVSGVPAGFTPTYDADGVDTPGTSSLSLSTSDPAVPASDLAQDFGYAGSGSIGDTVWLDRDGDGRQGSATDEPGLPGVGVTLVWAGPDGVSGGGDDVTFTTTTDVDGRYSFVGLPVGAYSVTLDRSTLAGGLVATHDLDGGGDLTTVVTLTTEQPARDDVDFGLRGTGAIGDTVWLDRDGDGVLDADERGLSAVGVRVEWAGVDGIVGTADDEVFTTVTDAAGRYEVAGLPAGSYRVVVDTATLPGGVTPSADEDGVLDDATTVTLAAGERHETADFGYVGAASIGDTVWFDLDGDGVRGDGEQGVPGQRVDLTWAGADGAFGTADDQTFTTTTSADGSYSFTRLPDGAYRVTVVGGIADAAENTGDPDGGAADVADVTIVGGVSDLEQDFGYRGTNGIGDTVWWDEDGDGVDAPDEPRLAGVALELTWAGPDGVSGGGDDVTFTTTTDADGRYLVTGLPSGRWAVEVVGGVPAGLRPSVDAGDVTDADGRSGVTLAGGTVDLDQDFGFVGAGSIGDTVWLDQDGDGRRGSAEPGIPGVTVTLTWGGSDGTLGTPDDLVSTATTDADGRYLFERLAAGAFRVELGGVPAGLSPTADPDGGDDLAAQLTLAAGGARLDQDFGFRGTASVGTVVWLDVDGDGKRGPVEPGVPGVTVTLHLAGLDGVVGTADDVVATTVTDASGRYSFDGLPAGPASVSYDRATLPAGVVPVSDRDGGDATTTAVELVAGQRLDGVDYVVAGTASLGGVVFDDRDGDGVRDAGEPGIGGVELTVTWQGPLGPVTIVVTTDADGSWTLTGLPAGSYTVVVVASTVPAGTRVSVGASTTVVLPAGGAATVVTGLSHRVLAFTGTDLGWSLAIGLSLLVAGGAAFAVSRRPARRSGAGDSTADAGR